MAAAGGQARAAATPAEKCAATKINAVAAAAGNELKCFEKAVTKGTVVDPACLAAAQARLRATFEKAEAKGGCETIDDSDATLTRVVDVFGVEVAEILPAPGIPPCNCGPTTPTRLAFTTAVGSGNCGEATAGGTPDPLACGGVYFGGGAVDPALLPELFPDMSTQVFKVTGCANTSLSLANTTAAELGGLNPERRCTSVGCTFGAPTPIPNPNSVALSSCIINEVAQDAAGTADCAIGAANIALPFLADIYLTGDLLPAVTGIQPCPLCVVAPPCVGGVPNGVLQAGEQCDDGNTSEADACCNNCSVAPCGPKCMGGPNDGLACTAGDSASLGPSFPTSHDCPPDPGFAIGTAFTLDEVLTTGTSSKTTGKSGAQVFCGFCRDVTGTASLCFEGDPAGPCPSSPMPGVPRRCVLNTDCTEPFESCVQRTGGAFGSGTTTDISETGELAGPLVDGSPHAATLVSVFCVGPTFSAGPDAVADLPGPGAVALPGTLQLLF